MRYRERIEDMSPESSQLHLVFHLCDTGPFAPLDLGGPRIGHLLVHALGRIRIRIRIRGGVGAGERVRVDIHRRLENLSRSRGWSRGLACGGCGGGDGGGFALGLVHGATCAHTAVPGLGLGLHGEEAAAAHAAHVGAELGVDRYELVAAAEVRVHVLGDWLWVGAHDAGHYGFGFFIAIDRAGGFEVLVAGGEGREGSFC